MSIKTSKKFSFPTTSEGEIRYFHGGYGGLKVGDFILPPTRTGAISQKHYGNPQCREDRVYVATQQWVAHAYAVLAPYPHIRVYEVQPIGDLEEDPDFYTPGLSFGCERAKVIRVLEDYRGKEREIMKRLGLAAGMQAEAEKARNSQLN
jgi:hypothetical protein